ncbi:MAG: patatin-like phospholipase family protein [Phycisphaeraceae bacterium]|nr:patatin-like phospholipase family protein [Phycisphaeraceae bacterium]
MSNADLKIGLALGGGGAKGLAHIAMLEVFDELHIRPHRMAGTSIGAVLGALYASGLKASQIREGVQRMIISKGDSFKAALKKKDVLKWLQFMDLEFRGHAIFKGDRFIEFLFSAMDIATFEALPIPLRIVATDFWASKQVVLETGELLPAVKASMGLPGVFTPVAINNRVLIDGGGVNPVPHDLLLDCDVVVAIDVMGTPQDEGKKMPNLFRAVLTTFDIMQNSIIKEKLEKHPPTLYIKPKIQGVDILDFYKANEVYAQAKPAQSNLRDQLKRLLSLDKAP